MIRLFAGLLWLALLLPTLAQAAWSGPTTTIDNKNGRRVIRICPQDGSACTQSTPLFLSINTQAPGFSWSTFRYEANQLLAWTSPSANGVAPILQVHLGNTSNAFIDELAAQLGVLSSRPYLMPRFYLETPVSPPPGFERTKWANMRGASFDDTGASGLPWAMNDAWLAYQEAEIERILNRLDALYPNRIVGVQLAYGDGGEFFVRPHGYRNGSMLSWGSDALCLDGVPSGSPSGCNLFPWSGGTSLYQFYLPDYSAHAVNSFCNWDQLPLVLRNLSCRAPTVVERNNATPGLPEPALGQANGVFLDPQNIDSLRAAYYQRHQSLRTVDAIVRLLAKAKQISGNRILTSAFYGYLTGLDAATPASGHTDLTRLLASPSVDLIVAPYSYRDARSLGQPFMTQGPMHAPSLHNKLWVDEDDTRTHLVCAPSCVVGGFQTSATLWDSIRALRRNVLSAGIRGNGLYFLDLGGSGWFGRPDMSGDSDALWANLTNAFRAVDALQLGALNAYRPQVAVFIDDLSFNYTAALTPAGVNSYAYATDLMPALVEDLGKLGTPVRQYLLSDLLTLSGPELDSIKFAILPNAFNVPAPLRSAIDQKLKTHGRTLLFVYAAGYMNQDAAASTAGISTFTGLQVRAGTTSLASLQQTYTINTQTGGPQYPLTPWFWIDDASATVLGRYSNQAVSLAYKSVPVAGGTFRSVYAASPKVPLAMLRHLSELAGVHHFVPAGDSVEANGNLVMVHAGSHGHRVIAFPSLHTRVFETGIYPSDNLLCSNCTQLPSLYFDKGDTRVFRWTTQPQGNFELILAPATLEGWAADLDAPSQSIQVEIHRNAPKGSAGSVYVATIPTQQPRPDVNAAYGIPGTHGFHYPLGNCVSGTRYYAYAIDADGSTGDGNRYIGQNVCP